MLKRCFHRPLRTPLCLRRHGHYARLGWGTRRFTQPLPHVEGPWMGSRFLSHMPSSGGAGFLGGPDGQPTFGVFSGQHIKEFPVRAAIDIGTGGVISLCIARVDAARAAVRNVMYQTQLPLCLEAACSSAGALGGSPGQVFASSPPTGPFALSTRTCVDIKNKMTTLSGVMRRDAYEGLSERAAVLSWPLCLAENAERLAADLTREFKVDVRVLGKTFDVEWPFGNPMKEAAATGEVDTAGDAGIYSKATCESASIGRRPGSAGAAAGEERDEDKDEENDSLRQLLRRASSGKSRRCRRSRESDSHKSETHRHDSQTKGFNVSAAQSTRAQVMQLAFLAHASLSQCVAPQRLLVVDEDPQLGVRIFGTDTSAAEDVHDILSAAADSAPEERASVYGKVSMWCDRGAADPGAREPTPSGAALAPATPAEAHGLVEFRVPVDVAQAHRYGVVDIQRRAAAHYGLHGSSPNPMLASEWAALRTMLERLITPILPAWVRRKSGLGGIIAGTSFNGGMLNLAARVAQQMPISLEHLEVHAQHHFCGLTDVLLATNFPNPLLVMPSTALAAALMRALHTPRISYLPELTIAAALLTQPSLWIYDRRNDIRKTLAHYEYHQSQKHRSFPRPHVKSNPTASPNAVWKSKRKF